MGFLRRLRVLTGVMRRVRSQGTPELLRILRRRPALAMGVSSYELGLMASGKVEERLKSLASLKVASLVGCPY